MLTNSLRWVLGTAAVLLTAGGCMDLGVENPNEPDRDRALATPSDVEALISGQFRTFWRIQQGRAPGPAMDALAEVEANSSANYGFEDQSTMPATPIVNQVAYSWGYWIQDPFLLQNRGLAAIRDGLQAIEARSLKVSDGPRLQAYAKLMQGLFHGNIALQYDRGFIVNEAQDDPTVVPELKSYQEMMTEARRNLAEARRIAGANAFTVPGGWIGPASMTSADFVRLAHSYEARFMAQVARTPAERAAVNWTEVLAHVNQGIRADFGVQLDGPGGVWQADYKSRDALNNSVHLALIGPADQSGRYLAWEATTPRDRLPFLLDTDDRRITGGTPTAPGRYAVYRNYTPNQVEKGTWRLSNYARQWYKAIGDTGFGFAPEMTLREMNLLAAEAHIRLNNPSAALPLINATRVTNGGLPAATLEGATGPRCTPRAIGPFAKSANVAEGGCGNLLQVLIHEARLEKAFLSQGSVYYDARGFGTLRSGKAIHAPIPMEDLQLLGIPHYTFGGGGPGSAP